MLTTTPGASKRSTATRRVSGMLSAAVIAALSLTCAEPAQADSDEVAALRQQVQELTRRLDALAQQQARAAAAPPAATAAPAPSPAPALTTPAFMAGPVKVTLGGFVELMVVNRSRNEAADWASNFNALIPFPQSPNYNLSEFHLTERQSRFSALAQGPGDDPNIAAEAYLEGDFGAAPSNGNNNESTSFSPRVRHFYADYWRKDAGWYLLFGQTWSLLTQNKVGINPRQENIPLTIDGQYVPGFNWTRTPQLRFVKTFGETVAFGLSLENPAALVTSATTAPATFLTTTNYSPVFNTQGAGSAYAGLITTDSAPDVIAKLAFDPGWGHYEVFAMDRTFRDRNSNIALAAHGNNSTNAVSYGGSVLLPIVPKVFEFTASVLAGEGIGRYGSAQLPDATIKPDGTLAAIKGYDVLVGFNWKPDPAWTLYAYAGREHADKTDFSVVDPVAAATYGFGYGSPRFNDSGCLIEGSAAACSGNTSSITQETLGGWWKFYQGTLGNMQLGVQLTHVTRDAYLGTVTGTPNTTVSPSTNINLGLISFRYYPYQK